MNADPYAANTLVSDLNLVREVYASAFSHGDIDLKKLNFAEKTIVKSIKAPTGDFRDWVAITAWAVSIAKALKVE